MFWTCWVATPIAGVVMPVSSCVGKRLRRGNVCHQPGSGTALSSSSFFPGFIRSLFGFLLGLRNKLQENHKKSISPVVFSEYHSIYFADLTPYVDLFRRQGGEMLEAAILLFRRDESSNSRMGCKGDLIFVHALGVCKGARSGPEACGYLSS